MSGNCFYSIDKGKAILNTIETPMWKSTEEFDASKIFKGAKTLLIKLKDSEKLKKYFNLFKNNI